VLPHAKALAWGFLALLLGAGFQLAAPMVIRAGVDALTTAFTPDRVPALAGWLLVLALGQALFKFLSRWAFLGSARRVEHALRMEYASHMLELPVERVEEALKGDLVSRALHDLQDLRLFLGVGLLSFVQTIVVTVAAAVLLWGIHPWLTLVAMAPFPVIAVIVRILSPRLHHRFLAADRTAGEVAAQVQEAVAGLRVTRTYRREAWQQERFDHENQRLCNARERVVWAWAGLFPVVGVLAGSGHVAVLGLGGYWVFKGQLTLGGLVAFSTYLAMLTWPMVALGWTLSLVQRGAAAMARIEEVRAWATDPDGAAPLPEPRGTCIAARDVSYRYPGARRPAVSGVSLEIPEGGTWALVGPTGCGKSTLVALLARLRRPASGTVEVHGVPVDRVAARYLRRHVAVVPQEDFFFSDTVAENVCLGRPRDDERVRWALEVAGLADEVARMPDGADTRVGEGGVTLSGGQRQRLGLARALYGRPSTLVLDGALSNLDARTARRVLRSLRRELPDATLVVVSHRALEVDEANRVWFLRGGVLEASGRHEELLARLPAYRRLYREEQLRQELEEGRA